MVGDEGAAIGVVGGVSAQEVGEGSGVVVEVVQRMLSPRH